MLVNHWPSRKNDQFVISRGLVHGSHSLKFNRDSVAIFNHPPMVSLYGRPVNFDRQTLKGVSDHFPTRRRSKRCERNPDEFRH